MLHVRHGGLPAPLGGFALSSLPPSPGRSLGKGPETGITLDGKDEGGKEKEPQSPEGLVCEQGLKESSVSKLAKNRVCVP